MSKSFCFICSSCPQDTKRAAKRRKTKIIIPKRHDKAQVHSVVDLFNPKMWPDLAAAEVRTKPNKPPDPVLATPAFLEPAEPAAITLHHFVKPKTPAAVDVDKASDCVVVHKNCGMICGYIYIYIYIFINPTKGSNYSKSPPQRTRFIHIYIYVYVRYIFINLNIYIYMGIPYVYIFIYIYISFRAQRTIVLMQAAGETAGIQPDAPELLSEARGVS